ncbi:hypothetical protein ACHAWC_006147 [Mediolabrus comicus]
MGVEQVDASNACIPPTHPLTFQALPLPTANRGEPIFVDGDGGRLNDNDDKRAPLVMYAWGKLIVVREINLNSSSGGSATTDSPSSTYLGPSGAPSTNGFVYRGHSAPVTSAKFSPAGTYVASGDSKGKLRIWAYDHEEHLPKIELQVLAGPIRDISWDFEGKRIVIIGEGMQSPENAKVVQWDTGVKCGDLGAHARKKGSSCAFRPCRPMRIATGGAEDATVLFHKGPPFQRVVGDGVVSEKCHERGAIHSLRYNKDGSMLASVGTDGNVCFYDGKDMKFIKKVEKVHKSSIYSCAWNRNGTHLLTCGADGFARLVDATSGEVVHEWDVASVQLGEDQSTTKVPMGAMLLGCTFVKGNIPIAIGFNGQMVVLSVPASLGLSSSADCIDKPIVITGHQAPISAMTFGRRGTNTIYTADTDGVIVEWDGSSGTPKGRVKDVNEVDSDITGKVHAGATITSLTFSEKDDKLYSAGWDDFIRISQGQNCVDKLKMESQPNAMTCGTSLVVVMTVDGLILVKDGKVISELVRLSYTATAVSISHDESMLYVGGDDCNIYIYSVVSSESANPLVESHVIKGGHLKPVHSLALSHDGTKLAAGDVRDVCVYSATDYSTIVSKGRWCFHTQKIGCLAWSPDDSVLASGGNDDDIFLWSVQKKMRRVHYRFSHRGGVTGLRFVENKGDDMMLVSVGNDGCMNFWNPTEDVNKKLK